MKVIYTETFIARLAAVEAYLDNPDAAERFVERVLDRADGLADHPRKGRKVPELDDDTWREFIEGNYRIVYSVDGETISVVTIFEGHRLPPWEDLEQP